MNFLLVSSLMINAISISLKYADTRAIIISRAYNASSVELPSSSANDHHEEMFNPTSHRLDPDPFPTISVRLLSNVSGLDLHSIPSIFIKQNSQLFEAKAIVISAANFSVRDGDESGLNRDTPTVLASLSHQSEDPAGVGPATSTLALSIPSSSGRKDSSRNDTGLLMSDFLGRNSYFLVTLAPQNISDDKTSAVLILAVHQIASPQTLTATTWVLIVMVIMIILLLGGICSIVVAHCEYWGDGREGDPEKMMVDLITPFRAPGDWSHHIHQEPASLRRAAPVDNDRRLEAGTTAAAGSTDRDDGHRFSLRDFKICHARKLSKILPYKHHPSSEDSDQCPQVLLSPTATATPTTSSTSSFMPLSPVTTPVTSIINTPASDQTLAFSDYHPLPSVPKKCLTTR